MVYLSSQRTQPYYTTYGIVIGRPVEWPANDVPLFQYVMLASPLIASLRVYMGPSATNRPRVPSLKLPIRALSESIGTGPCGSRSAENPTFSSAHNQRAVWQSPGALEAQKMTPRFYQISKIFKRSSSLQSSKRTLFRFFHHCSKICC